MTLRQNAKHALHFFTTFLTRPHHIGAVFPSSKFLAEAMVADLVFTAHDAVLELGPGTGPLTKSIVKRMSRPDLFLAIDREASFIRILKTQYPDFNFVQGEAQNMVQLAKTHLPCPVKIVVSALPFALFDETLQEAILSQLQILMQPGLTFRTFQYVHTFGTRNARRLRQRVSEIFGEPATRNLVLRNAPPAYVLSWTKTF